MSVIAPTRLRWWLRNFWPAPASINALERWRLVLGLALSVLLIGLLSRWWAQSHSMVVWMTGSFGGSAVLVFGTPSSPMAQPWPVIGGSMVAALTGALCSALIADPLLAGALAVAGAVALMLPLRCLHPPAAGMALFVVLSRSDGLQLVLFPVLFTVVLLVAVGVVYNSLTGRRYPHPQRTSRKFGAPGASTFVDADLDAALSHYNQVLDVSRADLEGLMHLAGKAAFQRTLGDLKCEDIMSKPPFAVEPGVSIKEAWALMRTEQIKALPVVDGQAHVQGIVTAADFMRLSSLEMSGGWGDRIKGWVKGRGQNPKNVQDVMTAPVQVVHAEQPVMDLVALFSRGGHHHLPIVDRSQRLVGVISQTDLLKALAAAVMPAGGEGA